MSRYQQDAQFPHPPDDMGETVAHVRPAAKPRRKLWRKLVRRFVLLPLLIALISGVIKYYMWKGDVAEQLQTAIAQVRERGEPLWYDELQPDPLPNGKDGTPAFLSAIDEYQIFYRAERRHACFASLTRSRVNLYSPNLPTADVEQIKQQLTEAQPVIDLLAEVVAFGSVRLPHDYELADPLLYEPEGSEALAAFEQLLGARIAMDVRANDADSAVHHLEILLRLIPSLQDEPRLITQLKRFMLGHTAVRSLCEILARLELGDDQRAALDQTLAAVEQTIRMRDAYLAERAALMTSIEKAPGNIGGEFGPQGLFDDGGLTLSLYTALRGAQMADQVALLELMTRDAEIADDPTPGLTADNKQRHDIVEQANPLHLACLLHAGPFSSIRKSNFFLRQRLSEARLALRIDRYYRREGNLPATLGQITGELETAPLNEVPLAILSQRPPVYRPAEFGFQLYDMGENQRDEQQQFARPAGADGGENQEVDEARTLLEVRYETDDETLRGWLPF